MQNTFDAWEGIFLQHHGIKGQKWGVRRFRNSDGTLTVEGRVRYGYADTGTGGSKKQTRSYNRDVKRLNKLRDRADIGLQKSNIQKFEGRAKKASKVGNIAAGVAVATGLGSHGLNKLGYAFDDKIVKSRTNESLRKMEANREYDRQWSKDYAKYRNGDISENEYRARSDVAYDANRIAKDNIHDEEYGIRVKNAKNRDNTFTARDVAKYVSYASAGTAAVAYGVAAYNKIKARVAKKRITGTGHQKAVYRYKEQYGKMLEKYKNTPYSELLKKQKKKVG